MTTSNITYKCDGCGRTTLTTADMIGEEMPCKRCDAFTTVPATGHLVPVRRTPTTQLVDSDRITFTCPGCDKVRNAGQDLVGFEFSCSKCDTLITVPEQSGLAMAATPSKRKSKDTVAIGVAMPHGLGAMKTEVTQETANSMASTFLGGALVAIGVGLTAFFGGKGRS